MNNIKVLHLTTHLNVGGITTYIYLLAKEMNKNGYEISVASSGGESSESFHQMGIATHEFNVRTKSELSPKLYMAIPKIIQLVQNEEIDLIHAHTRVAQVLAWWIQRFTRVPYVSTWHGFYKRRLGRRLLPAWGDHVIAISNPVEDSLLEKFQVPKEKVSTIFNAIDVEELEKKAAQKDVKAIRSEWNIKSSLPILGIVARIVQDKGHEYLIRAMTTLQKKFPDLKLLIVGEGPFKKHNERLVKELGLSNCIVFVGTLRDVTKALVVIDIFILPAIWREGFGLSIVEGMALKKPVIVTNIWALNAIVHDRVNGLLIEPKNVDALVSAITELIEHKELRDQISARAYETVKKEFCIDRMAREIDQLYRKIVNSRI